MSQERSLKFDDEKLPLHLIDPLWLKATAAVLAFGVQKYGAWNWAKGTFSHSQLYRAAMNHLQAHWEGEEFDPESGLPHLWHANCCLMFYTRYQYDNLGTDDRWNFESIRNPGSPFQALYSGPGAESQQGNDPGRGSRRTRGEAWDTLRRALREGVRPHAPGSRVEPGQCVYDERVLDEANQQQAGKPVYDVGRMEEFRQSLVATHSQNRPEGDASTASVSRRVGEIITGNPNSEPQPDYSHGEHGTLGLNRAAEHQPGPRDYANVVHEAGLRAVEEGLANLSPGSSPPSMGPETHSGGGPDEGEAASGVPGAPEAQEADPMQPHPPGYPVVSDKSRYGNKLSRGRRDSDGTDN